MVHLGKNVKEKRYEQVDYALKRWLGSDEKIIAVFKANRFKPPISGLVLTDSRMIAIKGIGSQIGIVYEIAADDILEFKPEKGIDKIIKLMTVKKNGEKIYVGMMKAEDISIAQKLLSNMSGKPNPINKIEVAHEKTDNKGATSGAIIFILIVGIIVSFAFPPLLLPFMVGAVVSLALSKSKRK